ncbi:MAG: hypothetical protein J7498_02040 [Sphingobium sp.]|nr:hypothetical protein [Sphingobium sp.]
MLRYDERVCCRLVRPCGYFLPDSETGRKLYEFLEICASGTVEMRYANGLAVPRSLFFSRCAPLLLSQKARDRIMVTTPYGYRSGAEILVNPASSKEPWGPLAPHRFQGR